MSVHNSVQGCVALTQWGVIRVQGPDSTSFLQSQLTSDVAALDTSQARLAGYCSAKGRLLASFVMWRVSPDELLLACSADLLAATMKRLSMFVLRSKCKLSDASNEVSLFGVAGEQTATQIGGTPPTEIWGRIDTDALTLIRLPDADGIARYLRAASAGMPPHGCGAMALDDWRWLEVRSGVPTIVAATVEQFVPQMINFELLKGVDFQKGCYPGQEVVSRSQYRGTVKRRLFLFDTSAEAVAGQDVFHSGDADQPCGMVVNAAPRRPSGSSLLVETKLAALAEGTIHLTRAGGPLLEVRTLPYPVPVDGG
jgi:folate-binding protein YgfZ